MRPELLILRVASKKVSRHPGGDDLKRMLQTRDVYIKIRKTERQKELCVISVDVMMMMMKLPILPCADKLELVLSTAPKTDNNDKDSKNRKRSH